MSVEEEKPVFKFKGLSYLYHIEHCRVRPVGFDRQGVKYFEIVDLVENKQFFTAEIIGIDEDIVIKDKYGIIRFCLHGWDKMGQMDAYVNIQKPIGAVKDLVFYDHNLVPIFTCQKTTLGPICFGPPSFKVSTILTSDDVGFITPEPASIHLKFDQLLDEGPKALLIAFALQIALAKYKFLNLNLGKVRYLYKDRAKSKAKKEAKRLAEQQERRASQATKQSGVVPVSIVPVMLVPQMVVPQQAQSPAPTERKESSNKGSQKQIFVIQMPETKPPPPLPPPQVIVIPQPAASSERRESIPPPPPMPPIPTIPPRDPNTDQNPEMLLVKITQRKQKLSNAGSTKQTLEAIDLETSYNQKQKLSNAGGSKQTLEVIDLETSYNPKHDDSEYVTATNIVKSAAPSHHTSGDSSHHYAKPLNVKKSADYSPPFQQKKSPPRGLKKEASATKLRNPSPLSATTRSQQRLAPSAARKVQSHQKTLRPETSKTSKVSSAGRGKPLWSH